MGIIGHHGNAFISFTVAVAATFASLYESFQALTLIQVSHFVEWFSGDDIDSIWTKTNISGTGTFVMVDAVDEGFSMAAQGSAPNRSSLNFNNKRHYDETECIMISIARRVSTAAGFIYVGLFNSITSPSPDSAYLIENTVNTFKQLGTYNATTPSQTDSDIVIDTNFHVYKIECTSANIQLTIDGVLKVTKITDRPSTRLQPLVFAQSDNATPTEVIIRFLEAFNTSISISSSLYERLSPLTQVMGQRVVDTFSGALLNERWTTQNLVGTNTFAMADEIDGGFKITTGTAGSDNGQMAFNNKRQYDPTDCVLIGVVKKTSASATRTRFGYGNTAFNIGTDVAYLEASTQQTNFGLQTANGSISFTASSVALDENWHTHKIEGRSGDTQLTIDGVLEVTKTTDRPTLKCQPTLYVLDLATSSAKEGQIRYLEIYNKLTTETDFPSVYELFNPLTTIAKQHFWDWFDGSALNNRWVTGTSSGGGTFSMADSIDGGFQLVTNSGVFDELNIGFGTFVGTGVRQFSPTASVVIFTIQQSRTTDIGSMVRMWNDNVTGERAVLGADTGKNASFYILNTGDATTESNTATSVALNTNMNGFKIELDSADIKAFVNGVLEVTKTTNRPTAKLEPQVECISRIASSATTNVRYMECYNT